MLSDAQWAVLEPLVGHLPAQRQDAPKLRRTVSAILLRHQNGANLPVMRLPCGQADLHDDLNHRFPLSLTFGAAPERGHRQR